MKYIYTAILIPEDDGSGFFARVPDLPGCITTGKDFSDAIDQITDAASIWLVDAEDDHPEDINPPRNQSDIERPDNAVLTLIQIDTIVYRAKIDTRAVRKNVSLPAWMANLADKRGINCSQVLQEGLMEKFA
ncbi:MAG: type II toxin-antitoxin system HicB family antitoxin [Lachnospiraceae bacterium]|nr:type II toxin-antitoxin system HicB family antitoxin [Lachnospiraceae bacterium]